MNCEESSRQVSRLLDGELGAGEEAALREHLAGCAACRKLEREQRRLQEAVKGMLVSMPAGGRPQRLREAVLREIAKPRAREVKLSFRIVSLAAVVLLSASVAALSALLVQSRDAAARLVAEGRSPAEAPPGRTPLNGLPGFRSALDERGTAEYVEAFGKAENYLGGGMRWMAVEGNDVEVGMSGSGETAATAAGEKREVIVLALRYVERYSNGESKVLSDPKFIVIPGEEASVHFAQKEGAAENLFRYRVRADLAERGQIQASVAFSRETTGGGEKRVEIVSPITASVQLPEGTSVLLGANGDASCRCELYLSAALRGANMDAQSGHESHL